MTRQCPDYEWASKLPVKELAEFLKKHDDELEWYLEMLKKEKDSKNHNIDENLIEFGKASLYLAHDLKNPLSVIRNAAYMIKERKPPLDEKTSELLDVIERMTSKTITHINDTLSDTPKTLVLQKNSILEIINSAIDQLLIPDSVKINLPQHDLRIVCDALKIERVFANLIGNAMHAMDNKGTVNIQINEYENEVVIKVVDKGKGIPPEILPKIFDPLITTKFNGKGVGLAASKEIIEMHDGRIDVKSDEGVGTQFFIRLPKNSF